MIDLDKLIEVILEYLNDIPLEERYCYQIVIREDLKSKFTSLQIHDFMIFSLDETHRPLHFSPYVFDDIIIINNKVRPIKDLKILQINDFMNH